eukprot:1159203-Pelagomonas_calceolata.AAC.14
MSDAVEKRSDMRSEVWDAVAEVRRLRRPVMAMREDALLMPGLCVRVCVCMCVCTHVFQHEQQNIASSCYTTYL